MKASLSRLKELSDFSGKVVTAFHYIRLSTYREPCFHSPHHSDSGLFAEVAFLHGLYPLTIGKNPDFRRETPDFQVGGIEKVMDR